MAPRRALPREILAPFPLASQRQCRISERQSGEWCAHSDSPKGPATRARGTSGEHRLRPLKLGFRASASFGCCHSRVFLSSCLHPVFGPLFTHYPLFEWGLQSKEVLLNLGMKCWNSAFEVIIVVVHVEAVKIHVAVEALRRKERQDQNQMKLSLAQKVVHFWVWPLSPEG